MRITLSRYAHVYIDFRHCWISISAHARGREQIYDDLVPEDQEECVRRLGWLNIFDPMQPNRQFPPLDLSVRDERELVQILAQLALNEGVRAFNKLCVDCLCDVCNSS